MAGASIAREPARKTTGAPLSARLLASLYTQRSVATIIATTISGISALADMRRAYGYVSRGTLMQRKTAPTYSRYGCQAALEGRRGAVARFSGPQLIRTCWDSHDVLPRPPPRIGSVT